MRSCTTLTAITAMAMICAAEAGADTFGTGPNQFTMDFVSVAGDAGNLGSWPAGLYYTFAGVNRDSYRMGVFEVTNDQWNKFRTELGVPVMGDPISAYGHDATFTAANQPANMVSWYEAAQFVNWLNTSKGYPAAYKFTGTQGESNYRLSIWTAPEADGGGNLYRHKDAMYYLPTDAEWVKAAYWDGTQLQTFATKPGEILHQGDGTSGTGWNYYDDRYATSPVGPWAVGSGSKELNGTFDMMGNVGELMESAYLYPSYSYNSIRGLRGGGWNDWDNEIKSSYRFASNPFQEYNYVGFRVAADIPEPCTLGSLSFGALFFLLRRR